MQPIATIIMDLHLDLILTYTFQKMPIGITTVIAVVPLTEAVTVTISSQEAAISMLIM